MQGVSYGDLARTAPLTRRGAETRETMARLSQELTTGRHSDVARANRGDLRAATGIERNLTILASAEAAAQSAQHRMGAMQVALDTVSAAAGQAATSFLAMSDPAAAAGSGLAARAAEQALGSVVSALHARLGGVNLFSGTASDRAPLPALEAMMTQLRADIGPQTDAATMIAAVRDWFAPGAATGLDALHVVEGGDVATTLTVAPNETLTLDATAADPALRRVMADLAVGVLASELTDAGERRTALRTAGTAILGDTGEIAKLQSRLGIGEGQSERALIRVRSEISALELARGEVLGVDTAEAATKFQAAEAAVKTLYLVTARLSSLSFADYMR